MERKTTITPRHTLLSFLASPSPPVPTRPFPTTTLPHHGLCSPHVSVGGGPRGGETAAWPRGAARARWPVWEVARAGGALARAVPGPHSPVRCDEGRETLPETQSGGGSARRSPCMEGATAFHGCAPAHPNSPLASRPLSPPPAPSAPRSVSLFVFRACACWETRA